jgi:predicted transcriptional regulator
MNPPLSVRRLALTFLIGISLASVARADEPPKFASPEVNDYVKRQTAWMDEWIAAVEAGDFDKKSEVFKKMDEDRDKNIAAMREKLTNAEQPVFSKWRDDETKRMQKAVPPSEK